MQTSRLKRIAFLAETCAQNNITDIVISPGSRNAPIVIAFQSNPLINSHLIHDERSAAFFALGLAESSGKAVALTCTSGSALLNYAPAIVEAYYRQVPLLILSADRPEHLIDQGDGQTIRQKDVYANFIKQSFVYPENDEITEAFTVCNEVLNALKLLPSGPVHLNVPLDEPLYDTMEMPQFEVPKVVFERPERIEALDDLSIEKSWKEAKKKLLIVGQHQEDKRLENLIISLAEDPAVAVLVENTSNVQQFGSFCHCIDRTLATISEDELENFAPDLLISIGGAVISKRIKAYFRKFKAKHNWRVGLFSIEEDTYQSLTKSIKIHPTDFLSYLLQIPVAPQTNFGGLWKQKDLLANQIHQSFLKSAPYSDLTVFDLILDLIPDDANLHMGNSSVVRYCQLFDPVKSIHYFSNRGVSGIDGSASTAAGVAVQSEPKLNVLISGDISFFYDSNAFWNAALTSNFKVIVISNGGGGIFQIIPGPAQSAQAKTFFAPTSASVKGICEAYQLNYYRCESLNEINERISRFFKIEENNRPSVLEICTEKAENAKVLAEYFAALSKT